MTSSIPSHFQLNTHPVADPKAVICFGNARFTVLTSRLLRIEYSPNASFEDRASQVFWHRQQPIPPFEVRQADGGVEIITSHLHLRYTGGEFTSESLTINLPLADAYWFFGKKETGNLLGTARTLDGVCGQTKLEPGLLSRDGWTVVDDSRGLLFNESGWLEPRRETDAKDLYFFGYGQDYETCLADYGKVSGMVPVVPRWALGNWWSRYWAYTQQELTDLMLGFQSHGVPLSVCIIDMDWHLDGWTGYTWNEQLWPDHAAFLKFLHSLGLKSALNLHPADGVGLHEAMYPQLAKALGVDPANKEPVPFDLENQKFVEPYFEILHHQKEREGIDFWWMDWQQGNPSKLPGLNLLWWINHLHFLDLGRDPQVKRSFLYSRWGGLGNHRYPIGFSGDTVVTWDSLAFQPHFTATAANVNYGWWSHDIGGHMGGITEAELYARWVQFGVFSPIMRLHSTKDPFQERCPWGYDAETFRVVKGAMQLRHALIPYLYSMAYRNHLTGIPPIRPMYHIAPEQEQAYVCPNQYTFGSELIAAPFISPADPDLRLSRQVVWLPEGDWYGFFDGRHYTGGWHAVYGGLDEVPVFAKAGAIVPLGPMVEWGGVENPAELTVHIFPGADNHFNLHEDDGVTGKYLQGEYAVTSFDLKWKDGDAVFSIGKAQGKADLVPQERVYTLVFHAVECTGETEVDLNGSRIQVRNVYEEAHHTLTVPGVKLTPVDALSIHLQVQPHHADWRADAVQKILRAFRAGNDIKRAIDAHLYEIIADPARLAVYLVGLTKPQVRALVEMIAGVGVEHITNTGEELAVLWNNQADPRFTYILSVENFEVFDSNAGIVPVFQVIRPKSDFHARWWDGNSPALLQVDYASLFKMVILMNNDPTYPRPSQGLL